MFTSVLVANRGEIACRIFRTAKRMGMMTVAVYSDADAKAKHVREADRAVHIGPAPAAESYLRGDRIIAAAKETGAEAIHPGYGFLSENPEFAEAVVAAGLIWIGPTPAAIRAMGLKDESKRIAIAAGVPVLEGYQGEDQSEKRLLKAAKDIGFPVLIKAVAGGGGRGIREVKSADDFKAQLESAQREAKAAFGNDVVLIEKLVERPRHIEVQVFGDQHGNVVHLFERDCSLQRRRQKVIEEAPAPGMSDAVRAAMTDAAVKLARAVKYENAGTVEFIVDGNGPLREDGFWFLEMNTRLQVEHPVTEMITGLDLVEWQFRVAAGEELPLPQSDITMSGHAIEARICAEDPSEGFRPSVGKVLFPLGAARTQVRLDRGYDHGDVMPAAYDNLLAKLIVSGTDRASALQRAVEEISHLPLDGVTANVGFLRRCLQMDAFQSGAVHTDLIAAHLDALADRSRERRRAAELWLRARSDRNAHGAWDWQDGWRLNAKAQTLARCEIDQDVIEIDLAQEEDTVAPSFVGPGPRDVVVGGDVFRVEDVGASAELHAGEGGDEVKAPLPGKIVALMAKPGAAVKKGDALLTLEAMKMEHALKAPRDGVIAEINAEVGAQVKDGAVLVRLVAEGEA